MSDQDEPAGRNEAEISPGPTYPRSLLEHTRTGTNPSASSTWSLSVTFFSTFIIRVPLASAGTQHSTAAKSQTETSGDTKSIARETCF